MRVLFLSANLGGNVPPTMAVALELCRRGVQVEVAGILVGRGSAAASGGDTIDDAPTPTEIEASWGQRRDASGAPEPLGPTLLRIFLSRRLVTEAETLGNLPVEGIVTTGGFDLGDPAPAAPNVQIHGYVPHAEVLPGAALVIGHGGHSTTMKALAHGIPLLVMPLNPTADQGLIGDVVEGCGLGRRISARSDPATIRREVAELLQDPAVRERAQSTAARLRSAPPGAEVAADRILEAARS